MNCEYCGCQIFAGDRCCPRCGAPMLKVPSMMEYSPLMVGQDFQLNWNGTERRLND